MNFLRENHRTLWSCGIAMCFACREWSGADGGIQTLPYVFVQSACIGGSMYVFLSTTEEIERWKGRLIYAALLGVCRFIDIFRDDAASPIIPRLLFASAGGFLSSFLLYFVLKTLDDGLDNVLNRVRQFFARIADDL